MGVLDRFERGIERAVNGAFAKAFRSEVQPIEIASAMRREMDTKAAVIARGRTLVPNHYTVLLGATDHERLGDWQEALADELVDDVTGHAEQQRYSFVGPVRVQFSQDEDLTTGVFTVTSATVKGRIAPQAATPQSRVPAPSAPAPDETREAPPRPQGARARPTLEIDGQRYPLDQAVTVVGRGSEADIVLDDPGISRKHVEIRVGADAVHAVDLGSTNGTFVDGEKVASQRLVDGSVVTLGRSRMTLHTGHPRVG